MKEFEKRCFICSKEFEEDELYEVNIGNPYPVKMCFLCKINHNKSLNEGKNWKRVTEKKSYTGT